MRALWKAYFGAIAITVLLVFGWIVIRKIRDRADPGSAAGIAELRRLNGELRDLERQLSEQRKILGDSMTEEQVRRAAAAGQFPADRVDAYLETRRSTEAYVLVALPALIRSKRDEIEELRRQGK